MQESHWGVRWGVVGLFVRSPAGCASASGDRWAWWPSPGKSGRPETTTRRPDPAVPGSALCPPRWASTKGPRECPAGDRAPAGVGTTPALRKTRRERGREAPHSAGLSPERRQVCGERPRPTPHALRRRTRPPLTRTSEPVSATLSAPPLPSAEGSLSQQPHGVGALGPAAGCKRRAAAVRVPVWQLSPAGMGATLRICLPRWRRPRPGLGLGGRGGRQVDRGEVPTPSQGSGPEVHL